MVATVTGASRSWARTFIRALLALVVLVVVAALIAPLVGTGSFDDFGIGLRGGVLGAGATAVKFAISPLTTPFKRLVRDDLPDDGADICSLAIGPRSEPGSGMPDAELESLPGC